MCNYAAQLRITTTFSVEPIVLTSRAGPRAHLILNLEVVEGNQASN